MSDRTAKLQLWVMLAVAAIAFGAMLWFMARTSMVLAVGFFLFVAGVAVYVFFGDAFPRVQKAFQVLLMLSIATFFVVGLVGGVLKSCASAQACSSGEARYGLCD